MMMRPLYVIAIFLLIGCLTMPHLSLAQAEPAPSSGGVIGWINIESAGAAPQGQMLAISGRALALRPIEGRYTLDVKRHSGGGVTNSRQGGALTLQPGVTAMLSHSAINIAPGDSIDIDLKLYIGDQEVFSASMKSMSGGVKL